MTTAARATPARNLRPLNILRDLPVVADLIELCFNSTLDTDGHRYVQQMRQSGLDPSFVNWAQRMADSVSLPLTGFVWEEEGRIVGNVSLIPFRKDGRKIQLVANVATHPDYRRRGIARQLTESALELARKKGADEIWLQVRADNPGAIALYEQLGFVARAARSEWYRAYGVAGDDALSGFEIRRERGLAWGQQSAWLERLYPHLLEWYQMPWQIFRPGLGGMLERFFADYATIQWAAYKQGRLSGVLSSIERGRGNMLWAALPEQGDERALTALLAHACTGFDHSRPASLDFPADVAVEAIHAAGFQLRRTLVWMELQPFTR